MRSVAASPPDATLRSSLTVRYARPDDREAWDAFVEARPEADPLQLWAWADVRAPDGEPPTRLVVTDPTGAIRAVAGALVRQTSFGRTVLYVPHGPVWDRNGVDADVVLERILAGLRTAGRNARGIVVKVDPRSADPGDDERLRALLVRRRLVPARHDLQAPTTRIVDLRDGGDALMATWAAKARNHVRRAEREGVTVDVVRDADRAAIRAFHGVLEETAERGGFRRHDVGHFERLADALAPRGGWYLALARHEGRTIAAMAMPRLGDRAYYLYGASLRAPELRHLYGSYATMAASMRALATDGVRTLDMWGVVERDDPSNAEWQGFSDFKRLFGGEPLRHPGTFDLVVDRAWHLVRESRDRARETAGDVARVVRSRAGDLVRRRSGDGSAGSTDRSGGSTDGSANDRSVASPGADTRSEAS